MLALASDKDIGPLAGFGYLAGNSRRHACRLLRKADGRTLHLVDIESGAVLASAAPEAVNLDSRLGNLPSEIAFPCGWCFETMDHDALDAMLQSRRSERLHRWESFRLRLVLLVPLLPALGYAVWRWGLDALVAIAVAVTPAAIPRAIDNSNLQIIDQIIANPSRLEETRIQEARQIFARLEGAAGESRFGDYRLLFRSIPEIGPNAFAMPGGTIVITDMLIERFPDEDTIAGVLAHEIAHVSEGHVLQQLYRSTGTDLLGALIFGELGPILDGAASQSKTFLSLAYSREHESEADRIGVTLAAKAGFDPEGLARLFEELDDQGTAQDSSWWSTHPGLAERIAQIRDHAGEIRE